jgi:hypothetical protein
MKIKDKQMIVRWDPVTKAVGRNGTVNCSGVEVRVCEFEEAGTVSVVPLTGKGIPAHAGFYFPVQKISEIVKALKALRKSVEQSKQQNS